MSKRVAGHSATGGHSTVAGGLSTAVEGHSTAKGWICPRIRTKKGVDRKEEAVETVTAQTVPPICM